MAQSEDHQNLESLARQLVEDRRALVSRWEANLTDAMETGRQVAEMMQVLEAVRAAIKEEHQIEGAASFLA